MMTDKRQPQRWLMVTGFFGMTAVAMGAFAAHGLKALLDSNHLALIHTGAQYQLWHALALGLSAYWSQGASRALRVACWSFALGTLLFSGSLYLLALTDWPLGLVTPLGGCLLLVGWAALMVHGYSAARQA